MRTALFAACLGAVFAAGLRAAAPPHPATAPAPASSAAIQSLVSDLASSSFAVRQSAQSRLDQLPPAARQELAALAEAAADPEVKARLTARLDAINEQLALHPPGISVDFHDATINQVSAALATATGIRFADASPNEPLARFTLSVKDASLWEIIRQLSLQTPLSYGPAVNGARIYPTPEPRPNAPKLDKSMTLPRVAGPLIVFFDSVSPPTNGDTHAVSYHITIFGDPRMQIVGKSISFVASDDAANNLTILQSGPAGFGGSGPIGLVDYRRVNHMPWLITLATPENPKSLVTLKGAAQLQVVTNFATVTVEDPEQQLDKPIVVGGRTMTITAFDPGPGNYSSITIGMTAAIVATKNDPNAAEGSAVPLPVNFTIVDADGRLLCVNTVTASPHPVRFPSSGTRPLRVIFSAPMTWKKLSVPVELKDLPQPVH